MLTLTAPGAHVGPDGKPNGMVIPGQRGYHGPCASCADTRAKYPTLAQWNAACSGMFRVLMLRLRRRYGKDLQYYRGVEVQDGKSRTDGIGRGALHYHVVVRSSRPLVLAEVWRMARACGFGCSVDLRPIDLGSDEAQRIARYVSKYVTKGCEDRDFVPWSQRKVWERVNMVTGEVTELPYTSTQPTFRTWSQSARFGLTMRELRAKRRQVMDNLRRMRALAEDLAADALVPALDAPMTARGP